MIKYIIYIVVSMGGQDLHKFPVASYDSDYADIAVQAMKDKSYREQDVVNSVEESMKKFYPQSTITIRKEEIK